MKKIYVLVGILLLFIGFFAYQSLADADKEVTYELDGTTVTMNHPFKNGEFTGNGTVSFENGDSYTGDFVSGYFDGQGTFTSIEGWSYTGMFSAGLAHGKGVLSTVNGEEISGTFKEGVLQSE